MSCWGYLAASGDPEAQQILEQVRNGVLAFLAAPIDGTVQAFEGAVQTVQETLARANELEQAGKIDEAQRLRASLYTDGLLTMVPGVGMVVKGTGTVVKKEINGGEIQ